MWKKVTQAAKQPVNSGINNRIRGGERNEEVEKEWKYRDINMYGNGIKIYHGFTQRIWLDNNYFFKNKVYLTWTLLKHLI